MKRENKGVTLIALTVTIIVTLILASVATYSGVGIIRQSKFNKFTTEMKIVQTEVNELYDRYSNGEDSVLTIGKALDEQAEKVFISGVTGETNKTGYRIYDKNTLETLGIEDVEEKYIVNVEKRSVISYDGFKYEGETYYTLNQIPGGLYTVNYEDKNIGKQKPTFKVVGTSEAGKYTIVVSDIKFDGYINKWQVKYQKVGQTYWSTSEDLSFEVDSTGVYKVKIVNGDIESIEQQVEIK